MRFALPLLVAARSIQLAAIAVLASHPLAVHARAGSDRGIERCPRSASTRLLGDPATLGGQGVRAAQAVREEFGLDAECLRVVVLSHDELQSRARQLDKRSLSNPIAGFQSRKLGIDRTIFVEGNPDGAEDAVLIHETLHALSQRFSAETRRHRLDHLTEGITEYLARDVLIHQYGMRSASWAKRYAGYVAFVDELVEIIGRRQLVESFFRYGFADLERKVRDQLGWGTLAAAARALESDDAPTAISTLLRTSELPAPRAGSEARPGREELTRACARAGGKACFQLGLLFHEGKAVARDEARAFTLFKKSCDANSMDGCASLGFAYERGLGTAENRTRAAELYRRACVGGNAIACYNLGGQLSDTREAMPLYRKGCKAGFAPSCDRLARRYSLN